MSVLPLTILVSILAISVLSQTSYAQEEEYYSFENIPEEVEGKFGNLIDAFESDLNVISSLANPELDPRQMVNDDGLNSDYSLEGAIGQLKNIKSKVSADGSELSDASGGFAGGLFGSGNSFESLREDFVGGLIGTNVNIGLVLGVINTIAIIILAVLVKIKLSRSKILVEKPQGKDDSEMNDSSSYYQTFSCPDNNKKTVHRKIIKNGKEVMVHLCNEHRNHPAFRYAVETSPK